MSLEVIDGFPVLLVDFGSGTVRIEQKQIKLNDGGTHRIDIIWSKTVSITVSIRTSLDGISVKK